MQIHNEEDTCTICRCGIYKALKYKVVVELNCHIGTYGSLKRKEKTAHQRKALL